jgi:Zn finger protein HypA/HybF involved in hydrogenase expression
MHKRKVADAKIRRRVLWAEARTAIDVQIIVMKVTQGKSTHRDRFRLIMEEFTNGTMQEAGMTRSLY